MQSIISLSQYHPSTASGPHPFVATSTNSFASVLFTLARTKYCCSSPHKSGFAGTPFLQK